MIGAKDGSVTLFGAKITVSVNKIQIGNVSYVNTSDGTVRICVPVNRLETMSNVIREIDSNFKSWYDSSVSLQILEFTSENVKVDIK